jgi:hypothetical protein
LSINNHKTLFYEIQISFSYSLYSCIVQAFGQFYVNKEWEISYQHGIDTLRWGNSCTFDSAGYVVVGGSDKQANGSSGIFLKVINPSGANVWSRLYHHTTTGNDFAVKVATSINDGPDGYFVVGTSYSNSTYGYDIVLLQYRGKRYSCVGI